MKRPISGIVIALLLTSMFALTFDIQIVEAQGTIYIRADGSIDPPTAPIFSIDNITYMLTDSLYDSIAIERDHMILDGGGHTVQGTGSGYGIYMSGRTNVTAQNVQIKAFDYGVWLYNSMGNTVSASNISNNEHGVAVVSSSGSAVFGNNIAANNAMGISLIGASDNSVSNNNVTLNGLTGIELYGSSSYNSIKRNNIANNYDGIVIWESFGNSVTSNSIMTNEASGVFLYGAYDNNVTNNNITANKVFGIGFGSSGSSGNIFYHNNIIDNAQQAFSYSSASIWDSGYPSGGNYWSDYVGVDEERGVDQNETGSDGIGDTPYVIDENNQDRYPLMHQWSAHLLCDVNGDGSVDMADISLMIEWFMTSPPNWNPNCDVNNDLTIDMADISLAIEHFMQT